MKIHFAIVAARSARTPNPKIANNIAIIKNVIDQLSKPIKY